MMAYTSTLQRNRTVFGKNKAIQNSAIHWQSKRIGLLYHDEQSGAEFWNAMEDLRESVLDHEGQYISLELSESSGETFAEMFYAALKNSRWERSLSFSLPVILQHNPRVASPFLNQAILWQRLCDLIIMDDEPDRKTVLVLENVEHASPTVQHEIARLLRFHVAHDIQRTFVFTLDNLAGTPVNRIIPKLRDLIGI